MYESMTDEQIKIMAKMWGVTESPFETIHDLKFRLKHAVYALGVKFLDERLERK